MTLVCLFDCIFISDHSLVRSLNICSCYMRLDNMTRDKIRWNKIRLLDLHFKLCLGQFHFTFVTSVSVIIELSCCNPSFGHYLNFIWDPSFCHWLIWSRYERLDKRKIRLYRIRHNVTTKLFVCVSKMKPYAIMILLSDIIVCWPFSFLLKFLTIR